MSETIRESTLDEAKNLTTGDRDKQYGTPLDNFTIIAQAMNAFGYRGPAGRELVASDVSFFQNVVKLARLVNTPDHKDSWVDIAGYAACGNEVSQQQYGRKKDGA